MNDPIRRALAELEATSPVRLTVDQVVEVFRALAELALTPGERTDALHTILRARKLTPWNGLHRLGTLCQRHTCERRDDERAAFARLAQVCGLAWRAQSRASGIALARATVEGPR